MSQTSNIKNKADLNQYIRNKFAAHNEFFEAKEEKLDALKQAISATHMIHKENGINLNQGDNLKDAIYLDLKDLWWAEISGEIMDFLEIYIKSIGKYSKGKFNLENSPHINVEVQNSEFVNTENDDETKELLKVAGKSFS